MIRTVHIDELRSHLDHAKERLSLEKAKILKLNPLGADLNREEYFFAYVRTERVGMKAINRRLSEIAWLPMQLDPRSEMIAEDKQSMKRWLTSAVIGAPSAEIFGNDFIHALTRCGLKNGWDHAEFITLSARVANLFRDLSCLIGLLYYCSWMSENKIEELQLTNPDDLNRTAEEVAALLQSPEIYRFLRAQEQNTEKKITQSKRKSITKPPKKEKPVFQVIHNPQYTEEMVTV